MVNQENKNTRSKTRRSSHFDCVVGVGGGKDSTRQAHWVRDRLGLGPLLVLPISPLQMAILGLGTSLIFFQWV